MVDWGDDVEEICSGHKRSLDISYNESFFVNKNLKCLRCNSRSRDQFGE